MRKEVRSFISSMFSKNLSVFNDILKDSTGKLSASIDF